MGPVQVLVVGYEQPAFTGEVQRGRRGPRRAGRARLVAGELGPGGYDGVWLAEADLQHLAASSA